MVFAGPVFPEWYWGPLFFLILFSPVILVVAVVVNWRVRRLESVRGWATSGARRYAIVLASLVLSALLVAGALDWWRARAFERDARAQAAQLPFQPLAPVRPPAGYRTDRVSATEDSVFFAYERGERYLWLTERPVATFEGPGARCEITSRLGRGEQTWWDFACAEARTTGGDRVLVGER